NLPLPAHRTPEPENRFRAGAEFLLPALLPGPPPPLPPISVPFFFFSLYASRSFPKFPHQSLQCFHKVFPDSQISPSFIRYFFSFFLVLLKITVVWFSV